MTINSTHGYNSGELKIAFVTIHHHKTKWCTYRISVSLFGLYQH